jgi:hypothetical protein
MLTVWIRTKMAGAIMFTLTITPMRYSRRGNPRQVYNVPFRAYVNLALPTRSLPA